MGHDGSGSDESIVTPEDAVRRAQAGELLPVYLVHGEEAYRQAIVVDAIRQAVLSGGTPGLNEDQYVAGEADVETVLVTSRTMPMLARRRVVVVRHVERWEPKQKPGKKSKTEGALERLAAYAEAPAPETVLVLVASKLDKRRKLASGALKGGWLVSCDPLRPAELPGWLEKQARARGNPLAAGVASLVADLAGPELSGLKDALERLALYAGAGETITEDHVADCVVRVRPATVWELVDAVGRRDAGAALAALSLAFDPHEATRLVGVLAWSTRQLVKFEAARAEGASPEEAARAAGAPPFKARAFAAQIQRMPRRDLERWLDALAKVDVALKGGSGRSALAVLEHAIISLCRIAPARSRGRDRPLAPP